MADIVSEIGSFIDLYFTQPLAHPESVAPYNWANTLVFAALALLAVWLIFEGLKRYKVAVDERFFWAIIPFVVFGSAVRVVVDANILPRQVVIAGTTLYPFVTPGIYILTFLVVALAMLVAWLRAERDPCKPAFTGTLGKLGLVLAIVAVLPILPLLKHIPQAAYIIGLALIGLAASEVVARLLKGDRRMPNLERLMVFGQAFDGASTFVGVGLGVPGQSYAEQHVVGNLVFQTLGGPIAFYALKVLFAILVVEVLRRELKKDDERQTHVYLLLLITIMGLAPGIRDFLRIVSGV